MRWSAIFAAAVLLSKIEANDLLKLALDFSEVNNSGRLRACNFVNCWGIKNVLLMKEISADFRCSSVVNSPTKSMFDWFEPLHLQLFIVDLSCSGVKDFLKEAEKLLLFNGNFVWLMFNSREEECAGNLAMEYFHDLDVTVMSQVHVANRISDRNFEVLGIYKREPWEELIVEHLGLWTPDEGLVFTALMIPTVRRKDLQGRRFKASMVLTNEQSLNHINDLVDPQHDNAAKLNYVFWDHVIQAMNASWEVLVVPTWGENINGSFTGMFGYAQRKEIEVLVSPVLMSEERMKIIHYVTLTQNFRAKFFFLSPPLSYKNNIYLLPFSKNVWYCCIVLFASSVLLLYLTAAFEEKYIEMDTTARQKPLTKSWVDLIMLNIGTVCQQDLFIEPKGICGRIVILHVKIAVLFLYVSYSASILVLLQSSDRSITTLKDLHTSNFKLGVDDVPYNRFYFRTASDPLRKAIALQAAKQYGFMKPEDGLAKVRSGFFAFHVDTITGYLIVKEVFDEREKCRLQVVQESFIVDIDPLVTIRKDSPYRELVSIMFRKLSERGIIRRESQRRTAKRPSCQENIMSYASVGVIDCIGALELLSWGVLISLVMFISEISFFRFNARKMNVSPLKYGFYN